MQVCRRCLYPSNHALNIIFDSEGICSGCRVHEEKDNINWSQKGEKLKYILESYKNKSGNNYDCIIPVSGARDSYFTVHVVKNIYKMNPLLVSYNKHYNTSVGIRNLANLRINFDCDIMNLTVNPKTVKKLTRSTLRRIGSIYWHCLAGQTVYPVQMAVKLKIPLIIWGAHQGLDQVGMFSHFDEVEMTRKYRKEHDLMGYEAQDLINEFDEISIEDVEPYIYPDNLEIEKIGVRGIYLNNYLRWDSRTQHEDMIKKYGYETALQNRTFDNYNDIDCWNYSDVHDYIKLLKHGYSKVIDHASRDIRLNLMSREEGIKMALKYSQKQPLNLPLFLEWLGITENSFNYIIDQHRNPKIWLRDENWEWQMRRSNNLLSKLASGLLEEYADSIFKDFILTEPKESLDRSDKYILIGKGCN